MLKSFMKLFETETLVVEKKEVRKITVMCESTEQASKDAAFFLDIKGEIDVYFYVFTEVHPCLKLELRNS